MSTDTTNKETSDLDEEYSLEDDIKDTRGFAKGYAMLLVVTSALFVSGLVYLISLSEDPVNFALVFFTLIALTALAVYITGKLLVAIFDYGDLRAQKYHS